MSDDSNKELARDLIKNATTGEFYKDAVQPLAKQVGKALETGGRAVNVILMPLEGVIWTGEQVRDWVKVAVGKKIEQTPPENVQPAKVSIAAPAVDAARFKSEEPDLQDMFANLLATAIDQRVRGRALPAFVEVLKQLTSDEAKLLKKIEAGLPVPIVHIRRSTEPPGLLGMMGTPGVTVYRNLSLIAKQAGCEVPGMVQSYLDNLERLALIRIFDDGSSYQADEIYADLENDVDVLAARKFAEDAGGHVGFIRSGLEITPFGRNFMDVCVLPYERHNAGAVQAAAAKDSNDSPET